MIYPVKINRTKENKLKIIWNDNSETEITITKLRDECPCVNCKGESVILENYIPLKKPFKPSGYYEIEKIEKVGNYAVQIYWKDGHNTGIYSWDYLREISDLIK